MSRRLLLALLATVAAVAALAPSAGAQQSQPRIIGGAPVGIESHPNQVRVRVSTITGTAECGGSIRDPNHVITAAHCAVNDIDGPLGVINPTALAPSNVQVFFGSADTNTQQQATVAEVQVMPQYLSGNNNYDAALLTLSADLPGYGGPAVNRIPFAGAGELAAAVAQGQTAVATGWGLTSNNGSQTNQLRVVSLPLRVDDACSQTYGAEFAPPLGVCAGGTGSAPENNPDTCNGDSGGPLSISVGGALKLAGITSFGQECGLPNTPAVYTEASNAEVCGFLGGGLECLTSPAPKVAPVARDTTRPAARVTSLRCKRRKCSFRVRTSDNSGAVRSLSARAYRRVRICRIGGGRRSCRTVLRNRKLKTKRISGGFSGTVKLSVARYRLDAVATDPTGNRSKPARKRFTVKKR